MRNPMMPLAAALLLGLAAPALAQQAGSAEAARTLAQNARVSFTAPMAAEQLTVPDAAPSVAVTYPRNAPGRGLAVASNQTR
jgi:uncharacterized protein YdeI (BOF family)